MSKFFSKILSLVVFLSLFFLVAPCSAEKTEVNLQDKSHAFQVIPSKIKSGSEFRLILPAVHPRKFAVRSPAGNWFYIVDDSNSFSFINPEIFYKQCVFDINVDDVKGLVFGDDGVSHVQNVFTYDGEYLFYFADNVETEPENTFSLSVHVNYIK